MRDSDAPPVDWIYFTLNSSMWSAVRRSVARAHPHILLRCSTIFVVGVVALFHDLPCMFAGRAQLQNGQENVPMASFVFKNQTYYNATIELHGASSRG